MNKKQSLTKASRDAARRKQERDEAKHLYELVGKITADYDHLKDIGAAWIATESMRQLHGVGLRKTKPMIYIGCHLQIRQIARSMMRGKWEDDETQSTEQHEMFPGLQKRYPIARVKPGDEPVYQRLEDLTDNDYEYNINRLTAEADHKQKHADLLKAHWNHVKANSKKAAVA